MFIAGFMGVRSEDIHCPEHNMKAANCCDINAYVRVVEKLGSENLIYFDKF